MFEITEYYRLIVPVFCFVMVMAAGHVIKTPSLAMWLSLLLGAVACAIESWLLPDRAPWVIMFQACLIVATSLLCFFARRIRRFALASPAEAA